MKKSQPRELNQDRKRRSCNRTQISHDGVRLTDRKVLRPPLKRDGQ